MRALLTLTLVLLVQTVDAFVSPVSLGKIAASSIPIYASNSASNDDNSSSMKRRDFVTASSTLISGLSFFHSSQSAFADDDISISNNGPIVVIGANGRTGSECVGACNDRGIPVVATSRGGVYTGAYGTSNVQSKVCDVTNAATISSAIEGSKAVIFAASASKQGGTPNAVDNVGLVNVAEACIKQNIPQLVIVSSGAVTKSDSPVFKFLNIFGKIMEEKIKGEDAVRALYAKNGGDKCTYCVIRPGGLTEEIGKGVSFLELNQGDVKSGRIARADVASLCIEATKYPSLTGATTFECYDGDTGKPLQSVGISNIMKQKNISSSEVFMSGKERRGATFEEIFTGLEKDFS